MILFNSRTELGLKCLILLGLVGCGPANKTETTKKGVPPVIDGCVGGPTSAAINFFRENPLTSSGDSALPFNAALTVAYTVAGSLTGLAGSCNLENDHFAILWDTLFPRNVASITSAGQAYAPSQPEFQQLNAFYYVTQLYSLQRSLGSDLSSLGKVALDAHCNYQSNAFFSPTYNEVCLGYVDVGSGKKVWAADDADVVVHETGHSINHALASTSIFSSSGEAGALDEAIADYWAMTVQDDPQLAEWFLGSIGPTYIRDATQNHLYPDSMVYEVHDDGRVIGEVLWDLRQAGNLGKNTTDRLVKTAVELLPGTTRFADFFQALYDASGPGFLSLSAAQRNLIVTKFSAKGLQRADDASSLRLSTSAGAKPLYIIDDHTISAQSGGNCNGQLDVGETALVLVNLENPSANALGMGTLTLTATPAGITIPSGGQLGEFFRLNAASDFVGSMTTGSTRADSTLMAGFLIKATSAGAKSFSAAFHPMYSDPTHTLSAGADVPISFSLTVGTAATANNCQDNSLWP